MNTEHDHDELCSDEFVETVEYEADSDEEEDTADVVNDKRANSRRILVMMKSLAPQDHDLEEDGENILMMLWGKLLQTR